MWNRYPIRGFLLVIISSILSASVRAEDPPITEAERLFALDVLPALKEKCLACHGDDPKTIRGGLDLSTRKAALIGGESGEPAFVIGKPDKSSLIHAIEWGNDLRMPPKENDRLTPEQITAFRRWVELGAAWPDDSTIATIRATAPREGVRVETSGGQSREWTERTYKLEDLWAYQPVSRPPIPTPIGEHVASPIDAFLNHRMQAEGLTPAGPADLVTLLRRLTFDVTGLPPTIHDINTFVLDERPDAFESRVDRLLASPAYGEQQARHWLDVVRYADSAGFSNDFPLPHAWRYRDYVVRSFNADKSYARFIHEQLAGDELFPDDPEMLIAVGFLRMGPFEHTGMAVEAITRQQYLDDVTNAIGETFLAHGLSCCKCHDHKFDPLPTRDYYRIQAAFAPVQLADRPVSWLPDENTNGLDEHQARIERLRREWGVELIVPPEATEEEREEAKLGVVKVNRKRKQELDYLAEFHRPFAMSVYSGPPRTYNSNKPFHPMPEKVPNGKPQEISILVGGSIEAPGERVSPGVLSALPGDSNLPDAMIGRRAALAEWITASDHPLTRRVIVNRLWQQHFGRGIAANPNNFGQTGAKPTHPELLDWLARELLRNDDSLKAIHRHILTSNAYRRASGDGKFYTSFAPRRLTAEELRDAMLAVSGELNSEIGGLPARPEINLEVALQPRHVMGSIGMAYQPDRTPDRRHRRTLYSMRIRTLHDPMLEVFDRPGEDLSCERRDESTVTPQVFALLNGQVSHDRALALARRLEREVNDTDAQIRTAFRLTVSREPDDPEQLAARAHVERMTRHHAMNPPVRTSFPTIVRREMVEEMTGLEFHWKERLDVFEDYVADTKPWEVGPETRALADLCLVLLNSSEFVYVY